jgi:hypothetical protein
MLPNADHRPAVPFECCALASVPARGRLELSRPPLAIADRDLAPVTETPVPKTTIEKERQARGGEQEVHAYLEHADLNDDMLAVPQAELVDGAAERALRTSVDRPVG